MDDVYLNHFSKDLQEAIRKKRKKIDKGYNDLVETNEKLTKQKEYLQDQLKKAGEEIKFLKADVKYERELRLEGAKYHNG
tara:strand:+ start:285 stop:524 length:240 start_codon:yes stop_codon:yes gene_type:complete